jgi:hypothetical protein
MKVAAALIGVVFRSIRVDHPDQLFNDMAHFTSSSCRSAEPWFDKVLAGHKVSCLSPKAVAGPLCCLNRSPARMVPEKNLNNVREQKPRPVVANLFAAVLTRQILGKISRRGRHVR